MLFTPFGELYGFVAPNVYIDVIIFSAEHQYIHLWDRAVAWKNLKLSI